MNRKNKLTAIVCLLLIALPIVAGYFSYDFGYRFSAVVSYNAGFNSGNATGCEVGRDLGFAEGNLSGYSLGYELGFNGGNFSGYASGYGKGYTGAVKLSYPAYSVVPIPAKGSNTNQTNIVLWRMEGDLNPRSTA